MELIGWIFFCISTGLCILCCYFGYKYLLKLKRIKFSIKSELEEQTKKLEKIKKKRFNAYGSMINFWTDEQRKHEFVIESLERIIKENDIYNELDKINNANKTRK